MTPHHCYTPLHASQVFGYDPLYRAGAFDILKTHLFNVTQAPVVPLTFLRINIAVSRPYPAIIGSWVPQSACVTPNVTVIFSWTLLDLQNGSEVLSNMPEVVASSPTLVVPPNRLVPGRSYQVTRPLPLRLP